MDQFQKAARRYEVLKANPVEVYNPHSDPVYAIPKVPGVLEPWAELSRVGVHTLTMRGIKVRAIAPQSFAYLPDSAYDFAFLSGHPANGITLNFGAAVGIGNKDHRAFEPRPYKPKE